MSFETIEVRDNYVYLTFVGPDRYKFCETLRQAMTVCLEHNLKNLLVNLLSYSGPFPSDCEQYDIVDKLQHCWDRRIAIAIVRQPKPGRPNGLGLITAQNRGLVVDVFDTDVQALNWLLEVHYPSFTLAPQFV